MALDTAVELDVHVSSMSGQQLDWSLRSDMDIKLLRQKVAAALDVGTWQLRRGF